MDDADTSNFAELKPISEVFENLRGDSVINSAHWLRRYSSKDILDAVDDIALGELGRRVLVSAGQLAWRERRLPLDQCERFVPDELEQKFERELRENYEHFQQARVRRAQIDHLESLSGRANVIPFPKKERLPRARLKKGSSA